MADSRTRALLDAVYRMMSSGTRRAPMTPDEINAARAMVVRDAADMASAIENKDIGGFTYDLGQGRMLEPETFGGSDRGISVSNIPRGGQIDQQTKITAQDIIDAFDEFQRRGQVYQGSSLGGWMDNGTRVIDPANVFGPDEARAAMRQARAFNQDAAFDFNRGEIKTPAYRREFRQGDAARAAALAALIAGLSADQGRD